MPPMNWYVTYNEPPNGLYQSQVVEVVSFVQNELRKDTLLISFISMRGYWKTRKELKRISDRVIVLPCLPRFMLFTWHVFLLAPLVLVSKPRKVVCRGSFAALICSRLRSITSAEIVLDARGLIFEEDREYDIYPKDISRRMRQIEIESIKTSDRITAITSEMFDYWKQEFEITFDEEIVIPCTVSDKMLERIDELKVEAYKSTLGYEDDDIVLVYSGSTARWQSLDRLVPWIQQLMELDDRIKVLFLSKSTEDIERLINLYPDRSTNLFVKHDEVMYYLACADYGLMLRSSSVTNSVSSPIKTAEYLLAGLGVITNTNLAVHRRIEQDNLGVVIRDFELIKDRLPKPSTRDREHFKEMGRAHFSKRSSSISQMYEKLYS